MRFFSLFILCAVPLPDLLSFPTRRSSDLLLLPIGFFGASFLGRYQKWCCRQPFLQSAFRSGQSCFLLLPRSEEHTSELQSRFDLVCRLLLENKNYLYLSLFTIYSLLFTHI